MAFSTETMVLVEVGLPFHRRMAYTQLHNEELMKNKLDLLEEK